jgi:PAS domain-containing protein
MICDRRACSLFSPLANTATIEGMSEEREFQLDFLFQTAAEGILITQADGYLARLNPAAAAMLELTPDRALGEHTAVLFKHRPALIRLCNAAGDHPAARWADMD